MDVRFLDFVEHVDQIRCDVLEAGTCMVFRLHHTFVYCRVNNINPVIVTDGSTPKIVA